MKLASSASVSIFGVDDHNPPSHTGLFVLLVAPQIESAVLKPLIIRLHCSVQAQGALRPASSPTKSSSSFLI